MRRGRPFRSLTAPRSLPALPPRCEQVLPFLEAPSIHTRIMALLAAACMVQQGDSEERDGAEGAEAKDGGRPGEHGSLGGPPAGLHLAEGQSTQRETERERGMALSGSAVDVASKAINAVAGATEAAVSAVGTAAQRAYETAMRPREPVAPRAVALCGGGELPALMDALRDHVLNDPLEGHVAQAAALELLERCVRHMQRVDPPAWQTQYQRTVQVW